MNKLMYSGFVCLAAASLQAAVIEQVIVRQQWPWSTDVKVEYKLSQVTTPVNLSVEAYNGDIKLDSSRLAAAIKGDMHGISTDGIGEFLIDPVVAFGTEKVALANFKVKLMVTDAPESAEVLYKIYDLSPETGTFPCTDVTRAELLNGKYGSVETDYSKVGAGFSTGLGDVIVWTGVTNYPNAKTTKLVMRKIKARGITWTMGAVSGDAAYSPTTQGQAHEVELTKDFFICVYPVTQEQYRKISRISFYGSPDPDQANPVAGNGNFTYETFRGVVKDAMSANMGVDLDYPTEAQWEYACRAGTTAELYSGKKLSSDNLNVIGWHLGNSGDDAQGTNARLHNVGLKLPNAFGLYDMIGSVYEGTADNFSIALPGYADGAKVTDPTGPETGTTCCRGGGVDLSNYFLTSNGRRAMNSHKYNGFRLAFTVAD